jgi:hypothetical protein
MCNLYSSWRLKSGIRNLCYLAVISLFSLHFFFFSAQKQVSLIFFQKDCHLPPNNFETRRDMYTYGSSFQKNIFQAGNPGESGEFEVWDNMASVKVISGGKLDSGSQQLSLKKRGSGAHHLAGKNHDSPARQLPNDHQSYPSKEVRSTTTVDSSHSSSSLTTAARPMLLESDRTSPEIQNIWQFQHGPTEAHQGYFLYSAYQVTTPALGRTELPVLSTNFG